VLLLLRLRMLRANLRLKDAGIVQRSEGSGKPSIETSRKGRLGVDQQAQSEADGVGQKSF